MRISGSQPGRPPPAGCHRQVPASSDRPTTDTPRTPRGPAAAWPSHLALCGKELSPHRLERHVAPDKEEERDLGRRGLQRPGIPLRRRALPLLLPLQALSHRRLLLPHRLRLVGAQALQAPCLLGKSVLLLLRGLLLRGLLLLLLLECCLLLCGLLLSNLLLLLLLKTCCLLLRLLLLHCCCLPRAGLPRCLLLPRLLPLLLLLPWLLQLRVPLLVLVQQLLPLVVLGLPLVVRRLLLLLHWLQLAAPRLLQDGAAAA